jgi:hypothetical protein
MKLTVVARGLLWEHRNLGQAFFENPDTHVQAVAKLIQAQKDDTGIPPTPRKSLGGTFRAKVRARPKFTPQ